jgi:hypothetical protein
MRIRPSRICVRLDDLLAEAGQRRFEIGQERRHRQSKAARAPRDALFDCRARVGAGIGSAPGQPRINSTIAGSRPACSAERRTMSSNGMVSTLAPIEAIAQAAGAAGLRVAADDDRHRFRDRLRIAADLVEFHELACEAGAVAGPQCAHGRDILIGALAATLEGNPGRLELLL